MRTAEIIPIEPYLIRRHAESAREAEASWSAFEDRIEARAAASWNLDGVSDPMLWTLAHLQTWSDIADYFGLDARA